MISLQTRSYSEREQDMRDLVNQLDVWLETGLYDLARVERLLTQLGDANDLSSVYLYTRNDQVKQAVERVARLRGVQLIPHDHVAIEF